MVAWILFFSWDELYFNPKVEGVNNLFNIFKFPLAILALSIPLGALYAANHRSEQSKYAAELADAQNKFSNYYKHVEEFTKYLENYRYVKAGKISLSNARELHFNFYGGRENYELMPKDKIERYAHDVELINEYWAKCSSSFGKSIDVSLVISSSEYDRALDGLIGLFSNNISFTDSDSGNEIYTLRENLFKKIIAVSGGAFIVKKQANLHRAIVYAHFLRYVIDFDRPSGQVSNVVDRLFSDHGIQFHR